MGALDAFYSTWSDARETFGQGAPQDGGKLDNSSQLMQMKAGVEAAAPDGRWHGPASEAYAAKNKAHAVAYGKLAELDTKMATEVTNASNVVTAGRQSLENTKSWVDSLVNSIPPGTSATDRDNKLLSIANQGIGQVSNIVAEATNKMTEISGRVQGYKGEYQAMGTPAGGPKEGSPDDPNKGGENEKKEEDGTPEAKAEHDVRNALGNGDPFAAARIDKVLNSIKPGETLSREQDAYLTQMQKQQKEMSVAELAKSEKRLNEHKNIIADSWQLMSNDDVKYSGGAGKPPQGAASQLPDDVRDVLQRADQTQSMNDRNPSEKALTFGSQLDAIAQIVKDGNPAFQTGTELDREMLFAADRAMDVIADSPQTGGATAIQSLFEAVDDDHQIINDHMMGRNHADTKDFLHDINAIDWPDNGKAAGHLFSWTNEAHNAHLVGERDLASETAAKYAQYIGSHPELLGSDNHTLGQINPELVRGYAHGLTPYIPEIAGLVDTPEGDPFNQFEPKGQALDQPVAKGIFSVLSTDPEAYKEFHGAVNAHALAASYSWAEEVKNGIPVAQNDSRLLDAQTLKGLSAVGTQQAADALGKNAHEMWQDQKSAYEVGQKIVTGGLGTIPGYGVVAGPSFDVFATVMEDSMIGKEPSTDHYTIPPASKAECARFALNALLANDVPLVSDPTGQFSPEKYFADPVQAGTHAGDTSSGDNPYESRPGYKPQVLDLDGLLEKGIKQNDADSVLTNVLNATLPNIPGDNVDPTQAMFDKYGQVTQNAAPKIAEPPK